MAYRNLMVPCSLDETMAMPMSLCFKCKPELDQTKDHRKPHSNVVGGKATTGSFQLCLSGKKCFFIECEALARFFNTKGSRSLKCDFPPASWEGVSVNCQVFAKPSGISQNHWAFSRLSSVEGALRQATPHFPL